MPVNATQDSAVRQLYAEHVPMLTAYTMRLVGGDRGKAEDAVQETLIRAWQNQERLAGFGAQARGWLRRVAYNVIIDGYRAARSRPIETDGLMMSWMPVADDSEVVLTRVIVKNALRQLPSEHRTVLAHMYFAGQTIAETAASLDIPPGTVKSRAHYALRKLRDLIDGHPPLAQKKSC